MRERNLNHPYPPVSGRYSAAARIGEPGTFPFPGRALCTRINQRSRSRLVDSDCDQSCVPVPAPKVANTLSLHEFRLFLQKSLFRMLRSVISMKAATEPRTSPETSNRRTPCRGLNLAIFHLDSAEGAQNSFSRHRGVGPSA